MGNKTGLGRGLASLIPDKNDKLTKLASGPEETASEPNGVLEATISVR